MRAIVIASSLLLGCATYHPRPGPHIARDSGTVFVRDGQRFIIGPLGGGSAELVNGLGPALEHVRRQQRLMRWGWAMFGVGFVTMLAGSIAADRVASENASTGLVVGATGLGLALLATGVVFTIKGQAALIDAINVYNDDVDARSAEAPR